MTENNPVGKRELSSKEFRDIILGKLLKNKKYADFYPSNPFYEYSILIENCIISDNEIVIENEVFNQPVILGENTIFNVRFTCKNCSFQSLSFRGVVFKSSVYLNGIFDNVDVENIHCKSSFIWESCTFKSLFLLENGRFDTTLDFEKCITEKGCSFKIENGIFNGTLTISGIYGGKVYLSGGSFNYNFRIGGKLKKTEFKNKFIINGGNFNDFLIIENSVFHEDFAINNKKVNIKKCQVISGNFEENFILAHASIDTATIFGGEFKKEFSTHFAQIRELYITGGTYEMINIKEGELRRFVVNHEDEIDNLNLSTDVLEIKEIVFRQSSIINAYLGGKSNLLLEKISFISTSLYKDSVIQVNQLMIKEIIFEYFVNLGYISFNNIIFYSVFYNIPFYSKGENNVNFKLTLINSDLGKTQFIDCQSNYQDLSVLEFANSKMLDIFVSDTTLPRQILFPEDKKDEQLDPFIYNYNRNRNDSQRELAFNQLKKVYENRGDISTSLDYHAKALNARRKILFGKLFRDFGDDLNLEYMPKIFYPIINIILFIILFFTIPLFDYHTESEKRDYYEWLSLSINQISNNHGSSWQRGLLMTTLVTGLCYSVYCYLSGFQIGDWNNEIHRKTFETLFSYSGDFLNPIQKDDIFKKFYHENSKIDFPFARIWGFASRIIIAYFVYQTIQAFRKYGKK